MSFKSVIPGVGGGGGGGTISVAAHSVIGNAGTVTQAGTSVLVGDSSITLPIGGVEINPTTNNVIAVPTPTYYMTYALDPGGAVDATTSVACRVAARVPSSVIFGNISKTISGTSQTTAATFLTAEADPGGAAMGAGNFVQLICCKLSDASAVANVRVQLYARSPLGVETVISNSSTTQISGTANVSVKVFARKPGADALRPIDRLGFRVQFARVSGPASFDATILNDASTFRSTTTTTIAGTGVPSPGYEYNVMSFGAVGDMLTLSDGLMSNGSTTLSSLTAVSLIGGFRQSMVGSTIEVTGALATGFPLLTTIASITNTSTIELAAPATQNTGISYLLNARCPPPTTTVTGDYLAGIDVLTLIGGTFTTAATVTVETTRMRELSAAVVNAGSLGTPGTVFLRGTTGVGTFAEIRATVTAAGTLDPASLQDVTLGVYTTNPTSITNEPVVPTDDNTLVGAAISFHTDCRSVSPLVVGSYTVVPPSTDPIFTSAASVSGATGAELTATWGTTGRTVFGTDDSAAFAAAITAAQAAHDRSAEVVVTAPARNFLVQSGSWPVMTQPIAINGAGSGQTKIYFGEGYTGPHAFGFSEIVGADGEQTNQGPNTMVAQQYRGAGVNGMSLFSNRTKTTPLNAIVFYDRCFGWTVDDVDFDSFYGAAILTGELYSKFVAYVGECNVGTVNSRTCGTSTLADFNWVARGNAARGNNVVWQSIQSVFPFGVGMIFKSYGSDRGDSTKAFYGDYFRCERVGGNPGGGTGDLLVFGSFDSTDQVADIVMDRVVLVSPQEGAAAIGFYGPTAKLRPRDIKINTLLVYGGGSYGTGLNVQAAGRVEIGITRMTTRDTNVVIAPSTTNPRNGIVGSGSTTGNLVLDASASATNNTYTGGAAVLSSDASGTGVIASGVLTVSSAVTTAGKFRVGSTITSTTTGMPYGLTIGSLGTGTGGNGTYNLLRLGAAYTGSVSSRPVAAALSVTRLGGAYNGGTKTLTVSAIQGSSAAWPWAPVAGETFSIQSLVEGPVILDAGGQEVDFTYSIGVNSDAVLGSPIHPIGTPGTTQTIAADYSWTGANQFTALRILDTATIVGSTSGTITLNAAAAAGTYEWDWPITAGTAGQVLTSQAGAGTPMTWTTPATGTVSSVTVSGGTTGLTGGSVSGAGGTITLSGITFGTMASQNAASVTISGGTITGMPTPSAATDVAIKSYVDGLIAGLQIKPDARVATAAALPSNIYVNGASGVGATITMVATGTLTVDGVVTALSDLILVKNEVASANNGLYLVTTAGAVGVAAVLTRSTSMDQAAEFSGAFIPVGSAGTANANSLWLANPTTPVTVGTTAIPFTQLNGATDLIAGAGIGISGNTISNTGVISLPTASTGTPFTLSPGTITNGSTLTLAIAGGTATAVPYFANSTSLAVGAAMTGNSVMLASSTGPKTVSGLTTNGNSQLTIGGAAIATGQLKISGNTSGTAIITVQTAAGTPTVTLGTSSGTPAVTLPAPLTIATATGDAAWTGLTANQLLYSSGTATVANLALPTNWTVTSGTLVPSNTITVGLSNNLTDTITAGTYDLGPVIQGGTVLNSYAHVASGTITYTGAIGQPGTYTSITGMTSLTSSSTTIDTIGTATAANVIAAGAHLWVVIAGTPPPGGDVFFTVKVP